MGVVDNVRCRRHLDFPRLFDLETRELETRSSAAGGRLRASHSWRGRNTRRSRFSSATRRSITTGSRRWRARKALSPTNPVPGLQRALHGARGPKSESLAGLAHNAPPAAGLAPDWYALAPHGFYAECARPALDYALLALVAAPALVIGALVVAAHAIAQRDLRHAFFVQPRVGHRGRVFNLIKFRTMREAREGNFAAWSGGDQARVTSFGKFLRNAHLDELPQLINVARGEMSFIGPRPEMLEVEAWASEHVEGFTSRLAIKPGITGLAQVTQGYTGRDIGAYTEKLAINRAYLERMSFAFDLQILARTCLWMLRGKGWDWQQQQPKR